MTIKQIEASLKSSNIPIPNEIGILEEYQQEGITQFYADISTNTSISSTSCEEISDIIEAAYGSLCMLRAMGVQEHQFNAAWEAFHKRAVANDRTTKLNLSFLLFTETDYPQYAKDAIAPNLLPKHEQGWRYLQEHPKHNPCDVKIERWYPESQAWLPAYCHAYEDNIFYLFREPVTE